MRTGDGNGTRHREDVRNGGMNEDPAKMRKVRRVRVVRTKRVTRQPGSLRQEAHVVPESRQSVPESTRRPQIDESGTPAPVSQEGNTATENRRVRRKVRRIVVSRDAGKPSQARTVEPTRVPSIPTEDELSQVALTYKMGYSDDAGGTDVSEGSLQGWTLDEDWEKAVERWATSEEVNPYARFQGGRKPISRKVRRHPRVFWKLYAFLVVLIVGFCGFAFLHTYDSLLRYEESQPSIYMDHFVSDLSKGGRVAEARLAECFDLDELGKYDSAELIRRRFMAGVGKDRSSYRVEEGGKSFDAGSPIYTVYVDDKPYLAVHMAVTGSYTRLSLLTITDWDIESGLVLTQDIPENADELVDGGLTYKVSVQDSSEVMINGKSVGDDLLMDEKTVIEGFEYAAQFVDPPEAVTYVVDGLRTPPEVLATDFDGKEVELDAGAYSYKAQALSEPNREADQLPVDVLGIAENWSLFMSDMLGGGDHGLSEVTSYLVPGSELYEQATAFATNIDITFVAGGVLSGFTEESVTNCVMYNDRLFSCDVHFVKNINVVATGEARPDEFDNWMIFAYIDSDDVPTPGWYLVNMQAIIEDG